MCIFCDPDQWGPFPVEELKDLEKGLEDVAAGRIVPLDVVDAEIAAKRVKDAEAPAPTPS